MNILMVTSEAAPFVKTGGLADVLGALPPALTQLGDKIAVVLPRYRAVKLENAKRVATNLSLSTGPHTYLADIDEVVREGVRYLFVDCPPLYDRPEIYGSYPDNHVRFAILSHAAIAVARHIFQPRVFHCHDWTTGLLGAYLRSNFASDPTFFGTRVVFTIHNLGYQGNFPSFTVPDLGLGPAVFQPGGAEFWGQVSFMKAGLIWADAITTVSPTYAQEIQTPAHGFGMDGVLRDRATKLHGILNGVDYNEWNPETDPLLATHYSADKLSGKTAAKRALLNEMGLPSGADALQRPLLGIISRFAQQKGFEIVGELGAWLAEQKLGIVALGSGEAPLEKMFLDLAAAHPQQFAVKIGYDNKLAHLIEAGADIFLMPSHYEPCGLNQIYSLRYGTVPVVHATGGLEDTVTADTGFKFRTHSAASLRQALEEALAEFRKPTLWTKRMRKGMSKDFSWDASARAYRDLYRSL